jgi:YesN/AraC family two-component response regulator
MYYIDQFLLMDIWIVSSLLQTIYPDEAAREIVYVDYQEAPALESETSLAAKRENHTRLLEKRHAAEQSFMDAITQGNARAALQELNRMKMDVAYLKRIGTTLESERIGVTIVRTTARLAASRAGLPSLIVDRISSENTASVMRAASVESISRAEEKMVRAFCTAVRSSKSQQYSALVQSMVYAMERDYAQDLTVQSIADQLDVSVNYLISACKRELGITPNAYLKQIRMKHAVRLLAGTDQTVQEVANNVGIPDANYFIKQFKAQYGETPMAFRKKYRV